MLTNTPIFLVSALRFGSLEPCTAVFKCKATLESGKRQRKKDEAKVFFSYEQKPFSDASQPMLGAWRSKL